MYAHSALQQHGLVILDSDIILLTVTDSQFMWNDLYQCDVVWRKI